MSRSSSGRVRRTTSAASRCCAGCRCARPGSTTSRRTRRGGTASRSPTPRVSTRSRSASTSAAWSCASTSRRMHGAPTRPRIAGRTASDPSSRSSAARPRSSPATARSVARSPASCRPSACASSRSSHGPRSASTARSGCPGPVTRTGRSPTGSSATPTWPRSLTEADILVVTMPLTEATRGHHQPDGHRRTAEPCVAHQRRAGRAGRRARPARRTPRSAASAGRSSTSSARSRSRADSPWWDVPNVIVTPHVSGHTLRFFDELVVENVRRYLAGEPLLNPVDPERGY